MPLSFAKMIEFNWLEFSCQDKLLLSNDEVHVWHFFFDREEPHISELELTLSEDELFKAERFYFQKDKQRFVIAHGILRKILGKYLNCEPGQLNFSYGSYGKPTINGMTEGNTLCFNMSHSHGLCLFAFTRNRKVGVDVEKICPLPNAEEIVKNYFSHTEILEFIMVPAHQKIDAFYNCWTRKEAFLKATGDGLNRSLDSFEVSLAPGKPVQLLNENINHTASSRWSLFELNPAPCFVGALAVEGNCVQKELLFQS